MSSHGNIMIESCSISRVSTAWPRFGGRSPRVVSGGYSTGEVGELQPRRSIWTSPVFGDAVASHQWLFTPAPISLSLHSHVFTTSHLNTYRHTHTHTHALTDRQTDTHPSRSSVRENADPDSCRAPGDGANDGSIPVESTQR